MGTSPTSLNAMRCFPASITCPAPNPGCSHFTAPVWRSTHLSGPAPNCLKLIIPYKCPSFTTGVLQRQPRGLSPLTRQISFASNPSPVLLTRQAAAPISYPALQNTTSPATTGQQAVEVRYGNANFQSGLPVAGSSRARPPC